MNLYNKTRGYKILYEENLKFSKICRTVLNKIIYLYPK